MLLMVSKVLDKKKNWHRFGRAQHRLFFESSSIASAPFMPVNAVKQSANIESTKQLPCLAVMQSCQRLMLAQGSLA